MRILSEYEQAFQIAKECLENRTKSRGKKLRNPPDQIHGPWAEDVHAAEHTLKYVFEKLHHNCYMLCVSNGSHELYKLESSTTSPSFKVPLTKLNKTIKGNQRKTLLKTLKSKQWRVMQCIVKPYRASTTSHAYPKFLEGISMPDGVFILNITDAVILREDGTEPWPMVTGSKSLGEYNFKSHLPILSSSGQKGYWDIPIPNYDDLRLVLGSDKIGVPELDWKQKKGIAVFRGGPTGCGYTLDTNMRLKLASMKSELLDVGIVENKSGTLKFDPNEGLGLLQTTQEKVGFLDLMTEQSKYKYIIHVDGNVAAYRLLKSMLTGSLILRVESQYTIWADHLLQEGKHYIGIKPDLTDLETVLDWCKNNDKKCHAIAQQGLKFAQKVLTKEFLREYFGQLLNTIA